MIFSFKKNQKERIPSKIATGTIVYAIGDIHGRMDLLAQLLKTLIDKIRSEPKKKHVVVFLGDYVDRGKSSAGVIDLLIKFAQSHKDTVLLRGNHEEAMQDFLAAPQSMAQWIDWGGRQTLESYGIKNIDDKPLNTLGAELVAAMPQTHKDFLENLQYYHKEDDYVFAHAGLRPGVPLEKQTPQDLCWIRGPFLKAKAADFPDFCVVHGHTPQDDYENLEWRINTDTAAYATGKLTAVILEGTKRTFIST